MNKNKKQRLYEIIECASEGDKASRAFDITIISLIIINVIIAIASTFKITKQVQTYFAYIEIVSVIIFTIEYCLRLYTADLAFPEMNKHKARIRYIFTFMALIDLISILPFYIPFIIPIDLRVLRMLRIIRLFRIFKINRYTTAISTINTVFKNKKSQLLSSIFIVSTLMIIASVLMYNIENPAQPNEFDNAFSSLWWAIATLTTIGYGDIYPITAMGKILSAVIAVLGIGLVAVPTGIISAGFMEVIDNNKKEKENAKDIEVELSSIRSEIKDFKKEIIDFKKEYFSELEATQQNQDNHNKEV